jgi:hypothetical protein
LKRPDAVIRIRNIPVNLNEARRKDLIETVLRCQKKLARGVVNTALFANGDLIYQIERAGREAQYVVYPEADVWGKPVASVNGLRLREQGAILSAEEQAAA